MTEEEKLDAGLPYDFCESGCKLRRNRTVYSVVSGRATKDFGAFMLRETLWFPPQFPVGLPEIYVSAAASIRQRKIGAAEGEELFVIALLGDAAVLDDGDAVGIANG